MPTYITMLKFTQLGIINIKQSPVRLDAAKKAFKAAGAEVKDYYLVMGQYDAVVVCEAPDDDTMAKLALTTGHREMFRQRLYVHLLRMNT